MHYGVCKTNFRLVLPARTEIMMDRLDHLLNFNRTALNLRAYRQEVLASNVANADTPHYKARDVDFRSALQNALSGKIDGPLNLKQTAAGHLPGDAQNAYASQLQYRTEYQGSVDGNTVNMDIERAAFAENAIQVEALLTFVRGQLSDVRQAMQTQ